jgi:hypothetical protein
MLKDRHLEPAIICNQILFYANIMSLQSQANMLHFYAARRPAFQIVRPEVQSKK